MFMRRTKKKNCGRYEKVSFSKCGSFGSFHLDDTLCGFRFRNYEMRYAATVLEHESMQWILFILFISMSTARNLVCPTNGKLIRILST